MHEHALECTRQDARSSTRQVPRQQTDTLPCAPRRQACTSSCRARLHAGLHRRAAPGSRTCRSTRCCRRRARPRRRRARRAGRPRARARGRPSSPRGPGMGLRAQPWRNVARARQAAARSAGPRPMHARPCMRLGLISPPPARRAFYAPAADRGNAFVSKAKAQRPGQQSTTQEHAPPHGDFSTGPA